MQLKHLVILISIIGTTFLYFITTFAQPTLIDISEIPQYEGKQIIIKGTVIEHYTTSYGGQIIQIKDEHNNQTMLFVEQITSVEYGDFIQATGTVQKYNDDWEIVVDQARLVKILQKWNSTHFPLWQIANNPEKYSGLNIKVEGYLDRLYETYFFLVDPDEEHEIFVTYKNSMGLNLTSGKMVIVEGRFQYDEHQLRYGIDVSDEHHSVTILEENT